MHIFYCGCLIHTFSMEEFFFLVKNLKGACIYTSRTHLKIIISLFWVVKPFFEILFLFLKKEFFVPGRFLFPFFPEENVLIFSFFRNISFFKNIISIDVYSWIAAKAVSKSSKISAICSVPTESRMVFGRIPCSNNSSSFN